ncbi:unnamed protein product [Parascedosporium putredinis]|uniref:Amino acid transporter transmembrane domain-containing protein n=1 Tax=Parascedosporium putredinis TaxID=1442378 RepID=A0A9P1M889_9PEZI|nr:unnamed protein product [Parascedosporium putredinis]CAI7993141.1 unnamed protein product [Parascedosporium putredinis]
MGFLSEKKADGGDIPSNDPEAQTTAETWESRKMARIDRPITRSISAVGGGVSGDTTSEQSISIDKQMELEADNAIKYRTCSWKKTAALLFSEYICLAIMSFPYSYATLGLVPGLILTVVVAALVLYTSLIVWEFCMRHPEVKDVCDIGQMLFWNHRWAWYFTAVMFLLNNTFIQGFHCLTGAKYLNTMTEGNSGVCTVGFSAIHLSEHCHFLGLVHIYFGTACHNIRGHRRSSGAGWPSLGDPTVYALPPPGTTFVMGMNAFMNISYTFIGQITLPSFIAEMKDPKDFPKALWAVTIAEIIVFSLVGSIIYAYTGTNYNTAPAFGSLGNVLYLKVSFSFMIPTIIFLGVLYASVSARFLFFRFFAGTRHMGENTVVGWLAWAGILGVTWILAFIISEVIPFFADLLSLMSSLFDSFFGFIFWGVAYIRMRRATYGAKFWATRGFRSCWDLRLGGEHYPRV